METVLTKILIWLGIIVGVIGFTLGSFDIAAGRTLGIGVFIGSSVVLGCSLIALAITYKK